MSRAWVPLALATWLLVACFPDAPSPGMELLRLGVPPLEQNTLMYVAADQGLFEANGLTVQFKDYESGPLALDALSTGSVELAETSEFPFVRAVLQQAPLSIVASNDKFENDYLAARRDRGVGTIADLKGKRIGVTLKTINEFYLGRLLDLNGLSVRDVTLVDVQPAQFMDALLGTDVDALIAWQPHIDRLLSRSTTPLVIWPAQSNQSAYGILVANQKWLSTHRETVTRFLRALSQAREYTVRHPSEAKAIVQKRLNYDASYIASIWPQHRFALSLDFSLLVAMDDEGRWLMANNRMPQRALPNWLEHLYLDALRAVEPAAVNIGH